MRIGTALIVLTDLLIRFTDLEAHYTNAGLWPTELVRNFDGMPVIGVCMYSAVLLPGSWFYLVCNYSLLFFYF